MAWIVETNGAGTERCLEAIRGGAALAVSCLPEIRRRSEIVGAARQRSLHARDEIAEPILPGNERAVGRSAPSALRPGFAI
jgi:hypothetical protein